jgi:hypothetical protein
MANDRARRLKQLPAQGLHLRTPPLLAERGAAKARDKLQASTPIPKNTALASNEPHGSGLQLLGR